MFKKTKDKNKQIICKPIIYKTKINKTHEKRWFSIIPYH